MFSAVNLGDVVKRWVKQHSFCTLSQKNLMYIATLSLTQYWCVACAVGYLVQAANTGKLAIWNVVFLLDLSWFKDVKFCEGCQGLL